MKTSVSGIGIFNFDTLYTFIPEGTFGFRA